ncbi:hypothetical protein Ahy_B08g090148 [Arachis hypogaea]|uniref:Uncharacterized protein n=1 Tax=Arachis hypogaea TaxID=3818 RepID=A0A444XZN7_ARAHY|nr:hypothetical protein Ahy_B08g090148 [Arachis hypogaea]
MEGELRCEGKERTAAACPAAALPTEPPNPPHLSTSCRRHQQRWRREKDANTRREREAFVLLLSCWRASCRESYCDELTTTEGPPPSVESRRRLGRCRRKRACTRGCWSGSPLPQAPLHLWPPGSHIEVAVLPPGFWSMGMALLLPEPPPVVPLLKHCFSY